MPKTLPLRNRLKVVRGRNDWRTQTDLAERIGVTRQTIITADEAEVVRNIVGVVLSPCEETPVAE